LALAPSSRPPVPILVAARPGGDVVEPKFRRSDKTNMINLRRWRAGPRALALGAEKSHPAARAPLLRAERMLEEDRPR
jgi:hypothetical protein